jgi:hypothetical protein
MFLFKQGKSWVTVPNPVLTRDRRRWLVGMQSRDGDAPGVDDGGTNHASARSTPPTNVIPRAADESGTKRDPAIPFPRMP